MIETSLMQVLIALSRNESMSKAAEELGVTQSAVSQGLKNLEGKVGFPILSRRGKSVVLTDQAKRLAKVAKQYFKRVDETVEQILQESGSMRGSLTIGTLAGIGKSWVSHKVVEFLAEYPEMDVRLAMEFPENLVKQFERGEVDCLILPEYLVPAYAERWPLHDEYSTLVFPDNKNYKFNEKTALKELMERPVLMFENNDPLFYRWCQEHYGAIPKQFRSRLVVNSFGQILQGVQEGLGMAVVPTHVLNRSFFKDKVKTLGKGSEVLNNRICFACHAQEASSLKIQTIYEELKAYAKSFGSR